MPMPSETSLPIEQEHELDALRAEAMGWIPLNHGVYLHQGAAPHSAEELVIEVVGLPDARMVGLNVLLLV